MKKESLDIKLYREDYSKKKIVIISTHWNAEIIEPMVKDCLETLKEFKDKKSKTKEKDQLIKSYGIGAQIIKSLKIKKMILVTRTLKKVVGLDGYGIKIIKQEIIK